MCINYIEIKSFKNLYELFIRIRKGEVLAIINDHRGVAKYFWCHEGILGYSYGEAFEPNGFFEVCNTDSVFYNDIIRYLKADDYELFILTEDEIYPLYLSYTADL